MIAKIPILGWYTSQANAKVTKNNGMQTIIAAKNTKAVVALLIKPPTKGI